MNTVDTLQPSATGIVASARPPVRHRGLRAVLVLGAVGLALLIGLVLLATQLSLPAPVTVHISGLDGLGDAAGHALPPAHRVVLAGLALAGLLAAAVVLPVALILVVLAVLALVVVAVALPILAVAAVLGLAAAPFLLLGWLAWRLIAG